MNRDIQGGILAWLLTACLLSAACASGPTASIRIDNPYAGVSWRDEHRHKAALHTHTRASDGQLFPHEVIDAYQALGYTVLAITDHNHVTHPWTSLHERLGEDYENRDPHATGMKDVPGNELSAHHHMNSFWTDHNGTTTEAASLDATAARNGQVIMNHPGAYQQETSWYVDLFRRYDHLCGMEIYNHGDRYPGDRKKWDELLTVTMPERPVWGFSNDDMHEPQELGLNWNVLLIKQPTEAQIRDALQRGRFYFVHCPKGHAGAAPPKLESITVDHRRGRISIRASNVQSIEWISNGEIVGTGPTLKLDDVKHLGSYVRAMLYGPNDNTVVGTQPFGLAAVGRRMAGEPGPPKPQEAPR